MMANLRSEVDNLRNQQRQQVKAIMPADKVVADTATVVHPEIVVPRQIQRISTQKIEDF